MSSSILIVDDERVWARNLTRYLRRQGFDARTAGSLTEAEVTLTEAPPALLCLDLRLPDGDGLELLARLRAGGDDTPCLLVTGHANEAIFRQAAALKAVVVEKPTTLADMRGQIAGLLAKKIRPVDPLTGEDGTEQSTWVVMYSHDGFGLGHMRRNLNIARRLTEQTSVNVLMLIGCPNGLFFDLSPQIDFIKLPSIVKVEEQAVVVEKPTTLADMRGQIAGLLAKKIRPVDPLTGEDGTEQSTWVVMYSHDGFGLGHMRRNLNIARRLTEQTSVNVLMLIGCPNGLFFDLPPQIDFIKLPSIVKVDTEQWKSRKLSLSLAATCTLRAGLILHTVQTLKPDLFLVDFIPQGVGRELLPTLDWLRQCDQPTQTVLGLRDILDHPERVQAAWQEQETLDLIERYYDRVLIYGREELFALGDLYGLSQRVPERLTYCGYLSPDTPPAPSRASVWRYPQRRRLVVTAGGGRDGFTLLSTAVEAMARLADNERPEAVLITGPMMEEDYRADLDRLTADLPVTIVYWTEDSRSLIKDADLVLCMAGYNTLTETVSLGKRPIVIPRRGPSQEQRLRTELFARLDLIRPIRPDELSADLLAQTIREELETPAAAGDIAAILPFDGLDRADDQLRRMLSAADHGKPAPKADHRAIVT